MGRGLGKNNINRESPGSGIGDSSEAAIVERLKRQAARADLTIASLKAVQAAYVSNNVSSFDGTRSIISLCAKATGFDAYSQECAHVASRLGLDVQFMLGKFETLSELIDDKSALFLAVVKMFGKLYADAQWLKSSALTEIASKTSKPPTDDKPTDLSAIEQAKVLVSSAHK